MDTQVHTVPTTNHPSSSAPAALGPAPGRWTAAARRSGAGVLAATAVGAVAGVLARVLMRLIALVAGGPTSFSVGGTVAIVLIFVVVVLPGAVACAFHLRRTGWALLRAAGALLLFQSVVIPLQEDLTPPGGPWTATLTLLLLVSFWALVVAEVLVVRRTAWRLGDRCQHPGR
jgi:hypothetical protein